MANTIDIPDSIRNSPLGKYTEEILAFYAPIILELPELRENPELMIEEIKDTSTSGTTDVATLADKSTEEKIKKAIDSLGHNWQFWGEEGDYSDELSAGKTHTVIVDPIEGTNNFKAQNEDQWGSVLALVDNDTKAPVIGIVAHPSKRNIYLGVKNVGAFKLHYGSSNELIEIESLSAESEKEEFTFNFSPHFENKLIAQASKLTDFAEEGSTRSEDSKYPERRSFSIRTKDGAIVNFTDPESGALEAVRYRGTIYFKTSNEMAAVFVIVGELRGVVTDADGKPWHMGLNTMISARNKDDYEFLKNLYNQTSA